jgi:hypothetical protein
MPSSVANGNQTAVVSTEHTLATDTTGYTYVLVVDVSNLANGDAVELRLYTKCRTAGTERLAYCRKYANAQEELIKYSPPVPANISCKATLKQTAGTARTFEWSLLAA